MKRYILLSLLLMIFSAWQLYAQQVMLQQDSTMPIEEFLTVIQERTPYRVYAVIDSTFNVTIENETDDPVQLLQSVLESTPYSVSVYGKSLFVLRQGSIVTNFHSSLTKKRQGDAQEGSIQFQMLRTEKATSENKVYSVGNPYAKETTNSVTITGRVTDFKTGEPLVGINIVMKEPWTAAVTDVNGSYSITLPSGRSQIDISGLNIKDSRRQLLLLGDGVLDIEIEEEQHMLDEVLVTTGRIQNVKSTQIGVEKLQIARIKNIPMALGEVDVLKAIQALPGVKTVGEASTGFNVRGGATDQNLILLNDGTIYNPNHLFGFFTAFSSDMIKDAEIYKSGIPARYGGRISSVLDITGKEANKEKFTGSAGIGLVTSKVNLEIPFIKEKSSLLVSGRTTYSDWILKQLPKKSGYNDGRAGFYDFGTTYSHMFNERNNLNIYGYYSHDRFSFSKNEKYEYTNINASAKWRTVFSDKLVGYFGGGYDHYDYENTESVEEAAAFKLSFNIDQLFVKSDFMYTITDNNKLDVGFKSMLYNINPGKYTPVGETSLVRPDALQKEKALETAFYAGDEWDITSKLSVNAGVRYSIFNALGPREYYKYQPNSLPYVSTVMDTVKAGSGKVINTYHGPEFRLSARYAFAENISVKAGFNSMRQYVHKLSNTTIMSPTDTWKLSDYNIKPQRGWQVATGVYINSSDDIWEFSLEGYYKKMSDYLDYRNKAKILMNHHLETDVITTEGYAYGTEFSVRKVAGKLNGWMSYTYSRTYLRQSDKLISNPVNDGRWYPTEYDKPHDFKFVGNYKFTQRYSMSVNVDYSTGRPTTIPAGQYYDNKLQAVQVYYLDRNSYRIPDYFRTDLSFNIEPSHKLTLLTHSSISFGVYNLTGRKNVYSIYYLSEEGKIQGYKMSIFGSPIPFVTYNIKF